MIPLHHLICLIILFLYGWHVYDDSMLFDLKLLFFPSLSFSDRVLAMQKLILALQIFFYSVSFLLFVIFLFTLIVSN